MPQATDEFSNQPMLDRSNSFIEQANRFSEKAPAHRVSESLTSAAMRFAVWLSAANARDAAAFRANKEAAAELYMQQARRMFDSHYDDYAQNFDAYIGAQRPDRI
jgi:hypothetical protein